MTFSLSPHRVCTYRLTEADKVRYTSAELCDWCTMPFGNVKPDIDHDRRCCGGAENGGKRRYCGACTRGFVHPMCNRYGINYFEWLEKEFGILDTRLSDYRVKFPVPRSVFKPEATKWSTICACGELSTRKGMCHNCYQKGWKKQKLLDNSATRH